MAATTISRATWTDGVSGTVIANARLQGDVYDKFDAVIAANITFGGTISAEGFGTHSLSAGGTGVNSLVIRNSTAGTANFASAEIRNDHASQLVGLRHYSTTFTSSADAFASGGHVYAQGAGGLSFSAQHASGIIRFYASSNSNLRASIDGTNGLYAENAHGLRIKNSGGTVINGITLSSGNVLQIGDNNAALMGNTLINAGGDMAFSCNGSTRAVILGTGPMQISSGSVSAPGLGFISDTDSGLFYDSVTYGGPVMAVNGVAHTAFRPVTASGGPNLSVGPGAYGGGAVAGASLTVGRNQTGSGAAGFVLFNDKNNGASCVWLDAAGNLRIISGSSGPTESGSISDTGGTVVGAQTSSRDMKDVLGLFIDRPVALRTVLDTPLYRWKYKPNSGIQGEEFMGIITDESPMFGMDRDEAHPGGRSLNVPNAIGLLVASVQELKLQINALRKGN